MLRHRKPAHHHSSQGRQRRAAILPQPAAADAGRRAALRAAQNACLHVTGRRSRR